MFGFLKGLFGGSNPTLNKNIEKFGSEGDFAQGIGQGDVTAASKWYRNILSGDPTKEAEAIAPEAAAAQQQSQQAKKTGAEFGNRGGGTAASTAALDSETRGQLIKLLGGLESGAASGAASLGTSEQGIALSAQDMQDKAAQQKMENEQNSILGNLIGGFTGAGAKAASRGLFGV